MGTQLDGIINKNYSKLNYLDFHILNFVQNNIHMSTTLSIAKLAERCNVSTATVLRMTQKLNFSGYSEFKYFLKNDDIQIERQDINSVEVLNQDIAQTIKLFRQNGQIEEIYKKIDEAENIYAYGTGQGQRLMLQEMARCFLNVNKKIIMISASTELKIVKKYMSQNDLLFIASWSEILKSTGKHWSIWMFLGLLWYRLPISTKMNCPVFPDIICTFRVPVLMK